MLGLKKLFKKKTESSFLKEEKPKAVDIYDNKGELLKSENMNGEEKRMAELLDTISKAGKTKKFMVCVSIHDPKNKLGKDGGDIHHYTFLQDFPTDDKYGALDEYAKLMGLGDR